MDRVAFITVEDGDDLIVSFALIAETPLDVESITLLRTPKYEFFLDDAERGVTFSDERSDDHEFEMLCKLCLKADRVALATDRAKYELDLSRVDPDELAEASHVLRKMNFDNRFHLSLP